MEPLDLVGTRITFLCNTNPNFSFGTIAEENLAENVEKVQLYLVDKATCRNTYVTDRKIPNGLMDHQICARGKEQNQSRQDTCQGDSG